MRIARSFNCGFDAMKIASPGGAAEFPATVLSVAPAGLCFFGGVDPQLKLRAVFGCSFGAKNACLKLDGELDFQRERRQTNR
jgi:hypothetical protein